MPGLAVVLFIVGLPIVLATAFVQEGGPVGPARAPRLKDRDLTRDITLIPELTPLLDADTAALPTAEPLERARRCLRVSRHAGDVTTFSPGDARCPRDGIAQTRCGIRFGTRRPAEGGPRRDQGVAPRPSHGDRAVRGDGLVLLPKFRCHTSAPACEARIAIGAD